jgi:hypothetical protein
MISNNHDLSNNESALENRTSFYKEDISEANINGTEKNIENWDIKNQMIYITQDDIK